MRGLFNGLIVIVAFTSAMILGGSVSMADTASYATGFEDFTVGPMSNDGTTAQNGWSLPSCLNRRTNSFVKR